MEIAEVRLLGIVLKRKLGQDRLLRKTRNKHDALILEGVGITGGIVKARARRRNLLLQSDL